jgi:WD40 repeat protein
MGKGEVRVVNADGTGDRVLVNDAIAPAWSPDGKCIAYIRKLAGKPPALCTVNPDGTNGKTLVEDLGPDSPFFPAWSPDGKWLALAITTEYGWQIALAPAAGGTLRQITHLPGFNINPVWIAADRVLFAHAIQPGASTGGYVSVKLDGTRLAIHPLSKAEPPHAIGRPAFFIPRKEVKSEIEPNPVRPAAFVEPGVAKGLAVKCVPVTNLPPTTQGAVFTATWSGDGKKLAFAFEGGAVCITEFDGKVLHPQDVFRGHEGPVSGLVFSSDNKTLISTGADKTVRAWDIAMKGSKSIESDHGVEVESLAVSPGGKLLATGDRDGKLKLRDAATCKGRIDIALCDAKRGGVHALAFSKDDGVLYAGCAKWGMPVLHGAVAAFDTASGEELWRTKGTIGGVFGLAVSPDGTKLAGACLDSFVRIWDAKTGKELACWKGHADRVTGVSWCLDGKALATGGFDHTVRIWDSATGTVLQTLAGHASPVVRVVAAPDGKHLVSTGQAGAICVWKLNTGD